MPRGRNLLEDFRMPYCVLTDREENGFGALLCQRPENGWRIAGPWTIVEGEHYFPITEKIVGLEVFEPEARSSGGVNFNDTCDTETLRIAGTRRSLRECP